MKKSILLLLLAISCSTPGGECRTNCGELVEKWHYREDQIVRYTYISECTGDTVVNTFKLNEDQLGEDNGNSFFSKYHVREMYCE